jgi:hypothetical protein
MKKKNLHSSGRFNELMQVYRRKIELKIKICSKKMKDTLRISLVSLRTRSRSFVIK